MAAPDAVLTLVKKFRAAERDFIQAMNLLRDRMLVIKGLREQMPSAAADRQLQTEADKGVALAKRGQLLSKAFTQGDEIISFVENKTGTTLGILPLLVPAGQIAIIAGAVALAYKLIAEIRDYIERSKFIEQRLGEGANTAQAVDEYSRANPKNTGIFGDIASLVWPLSILGAVLYLAKK